ncbi:MAG: hypothetical protein WCN92_12655 [Eubacteriales bacterium]
MNVATAKKNGNGNGKAEELKNPVSALKVLTDGKTEEKPKAEAQVIEAKPLTVEQRKERIFKLQLLSEKHDSLKTEMKKLEEFQISHDSDKCRLTIADDKGKEFRSCNPEAIKTMIEICKKSIFSKMENVENDIQL